MEAIWVEPAMSRDPWIRLLVRTEKTHVMSSARGCLKLASEKGVSLLKTVIAEGCEGQEEFVKELTKIQEEHLSGANPLQTQTKTWNKMASLMTACYNANEANHVLCPGCFEETPRCIAMCLNCKGSPVSHGTLKKIKIKVEEEDQKGKSVPRASDVKSETGGDDVGMEVDDSEEPIPDDQVDDDAPTKDDDVEMEEGDEVKESGAPEGFDANT